MTSTALSSITIVRLSSTAFLLPLPFHGEKYFSIASPPSEITGLTVPSRIASGQYFLATASGSFEVYAADHWSTTAFASSSPRVRSRPTRASLAPKEVEGNFYSW